MLNLLGEYECRCDEKGRLMLPAGLKKQLQEVLHEGFVINRDIFEKCLILYPMAQWKEISGEISKLSKFIADNVKFSRKFNNGATPIDLDASGRLLLPTSLMQYAEIRKDIVLTGNGDRIEIWSKKNHKAMLDEEVDMGKLSEKVMGGIQKQNKD
jgi:MraZ protein